MASDDSEYSAGAIHEALRIGKKSGARVRVIHMIANPGVELGLTADQIPEAVLERARAHLDEVEREAAAAGRRLRHRGDPHQPAPLPGDRRPGRPDAGRPDRDGPARASAAWRACASARRPPR
ncbi:MAG: universal stress protein [Chromatiales bacterium]|nr:universal stress protein [Chromatiales bacterium]